MAYQLVKHRKIRNTRHIEVLVNPEAPEEEQLVESFDWGMDVSLASVRRETKALLDAKYKVSEEVLSGEGKAL